MEADIAVVMVPLMAQGHLNQLLHLSRLVSAYNLPVHFVTTAPHVRQAKERVHGWDISTTPNLHFNNLQMPPLTNPQPDPNSTNKFPSQILPLLRSVTDLRPPLRELLQKLSTTARRLVVIYDSMMAYAVQDVSTLDNVESYSFQSISAYAMYAFIWEYAGRPEVPPEGEMVKLAPSSEGCFVPEFREIQNSIIATPRFNTGDIYNTSRVIEGTYLDLLATGKMTGANEQWVLGPFNSLSLTKIDRKNKWLQWLDNQEPNSVIFVSFGSTVSLSDKQIGELAEGLERSGQKFVWVLRDADKGDIFKGDVRRILLPEGYEERIARRGIIIRDWAPQLEILGHVSTGGFLSHCGWNSSMESISMGVPIAAWPMHSDQPRNACLITKVLKMGLEVRDWERREELVLASTIKQAVRRLMGSAEGDELRQRAADMGRAVRESAKETGAARKDMDLFIQHISR